MLKSLRSDSELLKKYTDPVYNESSASTFSAKTGFIRSFSKVLCNYKFANKSHGKVLLSS